MPESMNPKRALAEAVRTQAARWNVPSQNLYAVAMVESGGAIYAREVGHFMPVIRYEGHYVYRRLVGAARDAAVKAGLAHPKAGGVKNPVSQVDRYALLARCERFCRATAGASPDVPYESCSWGVGQVMGANWRDLGYSSCEAFVARVSDGLEGQLEVMVRFIEHNGLLGYLREGRWPSFARGYNGANYRANRYDTKLAELSAASAYLFLAAGATAEPDGMLRFGASGRRVRELQALLVRAGYALVVDGDFGQSTRTALRAFQKQQKLHVDGVYGPQTEAALMRFRPVDNAVPGHVPVTKLPEVRQAAVAGTSVVAGSVAVQQAVQEGVEKLAPYADTLGWVANVSAVLTVVATIAAVVAVAYGVYGWLRSKRTHEV